MLAKGRENSMPKACMYFFVNKARGQVVEAEGLKGIFGTPAGLNKNRC